MEMLQIIDQNNCLITVDDESFIYNVPSVGVYKAEGTSENWENEIAGLAKSLSDENIEEVVTYNKDKDPGLDTLSLILTRECNLRCRYCFEGEIKGNNKMSVETALEAIEILIEQARVDKKRKSINFFGGEPLMNFKALEEVVNRVIEVRDSEGLDISMSITTNFTLMTDSIFELIDKANITLLVSIDGDKKNNDRQRVFPDGRGSYDYLVNKIEKYIFRRPDLFRARATVMPENMNFIELVSNIEELGFDTVYFSIEDCFSKNRNIDRIVGIIEEYDNSFGEYIKYICDRIKAGNNDVNFVIYDVLESLWNRTLHFVPCHIGAGYIAVDPDGTLYSCQRLLGSEHAETHTLNKLKQNKNLYHTRTVHEKDDCPECWARYLCSGGCPALSIASDGTDLRPDKWRCSVRKIEIKWILWLFIKLLKNGYSINQFNRK